MANKKTLIEKSKRRMTWERGDVKLTREELLNVLKRVRKSSFKLKNNSLK